MNPQSSNLLTAALAQSTDAPPFSAQPDAGTTTAAPGSPSATPGGAAPRQGFDFITLMLFAVVLALIVSSVLGARREKKKFEAMMAAIKKHDQVRTTGGIIGSVVEVKPDVVVLKVDENSNTKITVARSKIEAVMKESATETA